MLYVNSKGREMLHLMQEDRARSVVPLLKASATRQSIEIDGRSAIVMIEGLAQTVSK